jgi:GT2 family glycosyltransferase
MTMRVAAIVPHWNRSDLLRTLLENTSRQTLPFDEIIVVDNGSVDESAAVAQRAGARVLPLGTNLGFAAAVNRGVRTTTAEWVAILNNDVTLAPDWLEKLLAALDDHSWFACGKILSASDPTRIDATFDEISRGACAWRCGADRLDGPVWNAPRRIRFAPMTAAIFRRELFDEIGLLDESFQSYLEDVEFGLRCALAHRAGVYQPAAVAYHQGSASLGAWHKDTVFRIARNQVLLAAKHFQGQPRWPVWVGQALWALIALRHGRMLPYVQGKLAGRSASRDVRPQLHERADLDRILHSSELEIRELQRKTGLDTYWRLYFWISRL